MTKTEKVSKGLLMTALICGTVVMGANPAGAASPAEESLDAFTLDPMVVTAQRRETRDLDTPAALEVLTRKDIENTGARTVFDAISFSTGITNFSYGPGGLDYGAMDSRVNIRGFERGALILVNGAPINLNGKNSLDGIMADNVEKIEILKGASSVLYGAEAFGGVINIITKKSGSNKLNAGIAAGNRGYKKVMSSYSSDKAYFAYSKQYFGAQDRTSPNREDRGYYNNRSKGNKANYAVSLNLMDHLNASFMRSEADSTYGQVTYNKKTEKANQNATKDYHYKDNKNSFNLIYDNKDNGFKSVLFYNDRDLYGETRTHKDYIYAANGSNYKAYNIGLDTQKVWNLRKNQDTFLAGILVSRDKYKGTSKVNAEQIADRENYALYAQYSYKFNPKFTAILGVREQFIEDMVKDQNVFLPQLQTLYKVNDNSSWYLNIGKAFQMPNLSDSMKKVKGKYALVSGRNLKPQEGWNYETGYKIINQANAWKFSLYYMDFKNMFGWEKDDGIDIRVNKGKFKNVGFEADYTAVLSDKFKANLGFSWSNPKNQEENGGMWTQTYPKIQFNSGVQYTLDKWDASLAFNWLTKRLKNRDGGTNPDLLSLNAVANYKMDKNNYFTLNLNNILDRHNVITNGAWEYWDMPFNWSITYNHTF